MGYALRENLVFNHVENEKIWTVPWLRQGCTIR